MKSAVAAAVLLALVSFGCGDVHTKAQDITAPSAPTSTPGAQAKLVILASSQSDQTLAITAQVLDANGVGVPNVDVALSISGGTVTPPSAKTDATGTVKAVAIASGTATVTATTGALTTTATVIGGATPLSVTMSVPSAITGAASTLSASVTGQPIGGPFAYVWTFGDNKGDSGSVNSITHVYGGAGSYAATVKVTDGVGRTATNGATAIVSDPVIVVVTPPPPPTLAASVICTANTHGTPSPCNVSATYGSAAIASNAITKIDWDWGDGQVQTVNNSPLGSHTYAQAGTYNITATVTATTTDGAKTAPASAKALAIN